MTMIISKILTTKFCFTCRCRVTFVVNYIYNRFCSYFKAKVDVNKDGNGANIFAYAFDLAREETSGCYFHEYIW